MALYQNCRFFVTDPSGDSPSFRWPVAYAEAALLAHTLTTDLHSFFHYTPWTFSSSHPLTDVECADDTVLKARTHETLSRLLHLLQHPAARTRLLLNGSKCQLLAIHGSLPVSLSLSLFTR